MIVVDTNILVRYAVKDDPQQTLTATRFLASHACLVIPTVLLETAWVLGSKSGYGLTREVVAERLRHIAGLPNVHVAEAAAIASALAWYEAGMDIADAIHLALSEESQGFATLDRRMTSLAEKIGLSNLCQFIGND